MCRFLTVAMIAVVIGGLAGQSPGAVLTYSADLDGASENPPTGSPGIGSFELKLDRVSHNMSFQISFSGLLSPTDGALSIYAPTALPDVGNAGAAVIVTGPSNYPQGFYSASGGGELLLTQLSSYDPAFLAANGGTAAGAEAAFIDALQADKAYVEIRTTEFPDGEIRGYLTQVVPEPATAIVWSFLAAVSAAVVYGRAKRPRV